MEGVMNDAGGARFRIFCTALSDLCGSSCSCRRTCDVMNVRDGCAWNFSFIFFPSLHPRAGTPRKLAIFDVML